MPGHLCLVLHAHLPFVRHPEHENFLEEDWLYEAISETYLPLLLAFRRLRRDGIPFRLTLSLSPTLISMLQDELLMRRYARHLDRLRQLADMECRRLRDDEKGRELAEFYLRRFSGLAELFHITCRGDIVGAFGDLQRSGHLEIITCCATHGLLPLFQRYPEAVRAQVSVAKEHYRRTFGTSPKGIWLPECGYYPGLERFLADEGLRYFFLDAHGILDASPRPRCGVYAPIATPSGVAAFGRDGEASQEVWSAETGYPGDGAYREFYRDIGYDLPLSYIRPFIQPTGERKNTGIKYHRITDRRSPDKELYDRSNALEKAQLHARDFSEKRTAQIRWLSKVMGPHQPPVVTAPYDAELFGHWWFEGPDFLEALIRESARVSHVYRLSTPSDVLRQNPILQCAVPPMCTWGDGGYLDVWVNETNDWIYRHLFKATERMVSLAGRFPDAEGLERRALNQALRELLLAQASDWAFIMKAGTMAPYAVRRTKDHILRFNRLADELTAGKIDEAHLRALEDRDNLFPELDYRVYAPTKPAKRGH